MKLTDRDISVIRDLALSHVLSRDQILALRHFTSVTRANTRLRGLARHKLVRRIETPFFGQSLYSVGCKAVEILGPRLGAMVAARTDSPRFIQHALYTTNVRIELTQRGSTGWRYEQQLRAHFNFQGKAFEVRPDGLALMPSCPTAIEVDLGHVSPLKFQAKLAAYHSFVRSGESKRQWSLPTFRLLTLTTGSKRAAHLSQLVPANPAFDFLCVPFEELGAPRIGAWS